MCSIHWRKIYELKINIYTINNHNISAGHKDIPPPPHLLTHEAYSLRCERKQNLI